MNLPENYIPILIQIAVALSFVVFTLIGSYFLGPRKVRNQKKDNAFECGVEVKGDARSPFYLFFLMWKSFFFILMQ